VISFPDVSRQVESATGLGIAVIAVMTITLAVINRIYNNILKDCR
jgi:Na+-transporting NADH:ubiquinone oxidoreductase subunit NqrE